MSQTADIAAQVVSLLSPQPGVGQVRYWAAFDPGAPEALQREVTLRFPQVTVADLESHPWEPWAPFASLAFRAPASKAYFRHAHLFRGPGIPEPEPLVDEELAYERSRLADTLLDRLAAGPAPSVVLVRHAELLSAESLFLAERLREPSHRPLILLFSFETRPRDPEAFDRLEGLGYLTWVGSPWSPLHPGTREPLVPPEASPDQRRQLMRWLCFETAALAKGEGADLDRLEALAGAGGFEGGIDLGEALVRRASSQEDPTVLRRLWMSLARLYRQAGDTAQAARFLTLGWKQARDVGDRVALARFDFLLFEASYRAFVVEDVSLGLEDRLMAALETLGWTNHLAYVLTKNVWIQAVGRTRGWDQAWALWKRGNALVHRTGNQRRLAVALQTRGSLQAIAGDLPSALASTRRAVKLARLYSSPLHTAKVENGLGFLAFTAGDYQRAWHHHGLALRLLPETRDHQEYVGTLVNLGRLYLLNDQADRALPLLTTAVRAMDGLGLADLPFHPRSTTWALLGACCLKTGQPGRAKEFLHKVRADEARAGRPLEHRACLEFLIAEFSGDTTHADLLLDEVARLVTARGPDLRHLLVWSLLERGRLRSQAGDPSGAAEAWNRAEALLLPPPLSKDERRHLRSLRSGGRGSVPRLDELHWDSPLLIRFSRQEKALRTLRRTVQDYGFLQTWNQELLPGMSEDELYQRAVALVRTHFPVDTVAILDGTQPRILALAPGSDPPLVQAVAQELSRPGGDPAVPLVEVFPLVHSGMIQARMVCLDTHPEPIFGDGDVRVLHLAADHLAVLLLSQRKALDLEERGAHLSRALEVLQDTQERLVASENLAVLGNLAAGLAHELNTPLGAIASASRTVQELLSGSLVSLWSEAASWSPHEQEIFRQLATRLVGREAGLGTVDRLRRRDLRRTLESWGVPDSEAQADLWFEVGLGEEEDLHRRWATAAGTTAILEKLIPVAQGHRLARVIEESSSRAGAVVGSLRSYLHGSPTEEPSEFTLVGELQAALAVLGAGRWRGVKVVWEGEPGLRLRGRRLSLAQVWTNLIQNSVQAMDGKGTLTLSARREGDEVWVEIGDTGPGIPEALRDQVFQPFFSTKKQIGGLGLGLDICRRIVEAHRGALVFESHPGQTVFQVRLPGV